MEWVEVTGKTVNAAKEAALEQLGVAEGDAELIVISEPKVGLFGRTRGEARVRARVRPVGARPKRQRRSGRDRGRASSSNRGSGSVEREAGRSGVERATAEKPPGRGRAAAPQADGPARRAGTSEGGGEGAGRSRSARRRRSRSRSRARLTAADGGGAVVRPGSQGPGNPGNPNPGDEEHDDGVDHGRREQNGRRPHTREEPEMGESAPLEEQVAVAKEFLDGLLVEYGFEASIETRVIDEETAELAAVGEGLGMLVGPKGSTLAALQNVTRTVVQRRFPNNRTGRILVDVAGYRERRAAALQRFSKQVAEEVIETGSERALEAMTPADRKIVHDAVHEIEGVATRSEGEDPDRYVVISPAG